MTTTPRPDLRVAIVAAAFNRLVTDRLLEGARAGLRSLGIADEGVTVAWTPGAFELPLAARRAAESGRFDAVICLGAVIRGETAHFDYVAGEAARGIREVAVATGVPVMFGVLTTDTLEQALARAGGSHGNKGFDCALGAAQMLDALERLSGPADRPAVAQPAGTGGGEEP